MRDNAVVIPKLQRSSVKIAINRPERKFRQTATTTLRDIRNYVGEVRAENVVQQSLGYLPTKYPSLLRKDMPKCSIGQDRFSFHKTHLLLSSVRRPGSTAVSRISNGQKEEEDTFDERDSPNRE